MNSIRKFLGLVMAAVVLGAFSLPAAAQSKLFTFSVTPARWPASSTSQAITVTYTNLGTSPPNSLELDGDSARAA